MGIKFQSPIDLSAHRAIRYNSAAQTLIVTVATKTAAHPEYGNGSTNGYVIDGIEGPYLEFTPGNTYKFDQSDSSNANHPLRFYEDAAKTTAYTTGVTTNGVPGQAGAYTQIIPATSVLPILYYQCSSHSLMGSYVKFGTGTIGDTYSINATQDGSNVDLNLDAASGTDSTVQLTAGSNVTLTRNGAQEVTIAASGGSQGITIQDEGTPLSTLATTLNFTGTNVTASGTGVTKTIDVSGSSGTAINQNSFTGNGSDTNFTLSTSITDEDNTFVFIQGVYQEKSTYSLSGTTLTFTTAPQNGYTIEVMAFSDVIVGNPGVTSVNGLTGAVTIGTGTDWQSTIQTSNFTAASGKGYFVNTTAGGITVTLPVGSVGSEIVIQDYAGTFNTNNVTINANGSEKIQGGTSPGLITTNNATTTLIYQDATQGWTSDDITLNQIDVSWGTPTGQGLTYTSPSPSSSAGDPGSNFITTIFTATQAGATLSGTASIAGLPSGITASQSYNNSNPGNVLTITLGGVYPTADSLNTILTLSGITVTVALDMNFLVVAGGGGAGRSDQYYGGGGGAGGYRSSSGGNGGGQSSDAVITGAAATNYTVTVGAGGTAPASAAQSGGNGNDSVFSTITSVGGGGGRFYDGNGLAGGCGGGAGGNYSAGTGGAAVTSPVVHGYAGGNMPFTGQYERGGAGGGGAGSVGANGASAAGAGGAAKASSITGTAVYYSGGGGGKGGYSRTSGGPGANGRMVANSGDGGGTNSAAVNPGYTNTGFSGIVIVTYPDSYTITIGAGLTSSTATLGSTSVTTFTAGTGNIQFN